MQSFAQGPKWKSMGTRRMHKAYAELCTRPMRSFAQGLCGALHKAYAELCTRPMRSFAQGLCGALHKARSEKAWTQGVCTRPMRSFARFKFREAPFGPCATIIDTLL
jgi:hypothetical protein